MVANAKTDEKSTNERIKIFEMETSYLKVTVPSSMILFPTLFKHKQNKSATLGLSNDLHGGKIPEVIIF